MQLLQTKRDLKKQTDWELVQACRDGDQSAWAELIMRYERLVFWIPRKQYGMTETDSADIMQAVFAIMVKSLGSFHAESNVKSWLVTVARRHTWRVLQKNDRETVLGESDLGETTLIERIDESEMSAAERWEVADWLNTGLYQLNEKCRDLLTALYLDSNSPSYDDIAAKFGMKVGSIGPTRARCLKKLRSILEKDLEEDRDRDGG